MVKRSLPEEKYQEEESFKDAGGEFPSWSSPEGSLRKIALHHVPLEWLPTSVVAIAASPKGCGFVATARESGAIELYDVRSGSSGLKLVKVLPGSKNSAISCLCWVGEHRDDLRLFSGGFDGSITEWSLDSLTKKSTQSSFGGAIWSISSIKHDKEHIIAIACDDGTIKFFQVENGGGLVLKGKVVADTGRVLTISWENEGRRIASGHSDGCVRVWEIDFSNEATAGQEIMKISLPSYRKQASTRFLRKKGNASAKPGQDGLESNVPTVWCVLYLGDGTIASSDSGGRVCFWDALHGTLIAKFDKHQADVTTMVATADNTGILASGADIRIAVFQRVSSDGMVKRTKSTLPGQPRRTVGEYNFFVVYCTDGGFKWTYSHAKRPHSHDVRALAVYNSGMEEYLVTGSQDTHVMWLASKGENAAQGFMETGLKAVAFSPEPPILQIVSLPADGPRLIISAQYKAIDFWQTWSDPENSWQDKEEHEAIGVFGQPRQIARVEIQDSCNMTCCQLSQCASYLASSNLKRMRLMRVQGLSGPHDNENGTNVWATNNSRISFKPLRSSHFNAALQLIFSPDSRYLCAAHSDNTISLIDMSALTVEATLTIDSTLLPVHPFRHQVQALMFDAKGKYLACTVFNRIYIFSFEDRKIYASFAVVSRIACACFNHSGKRLLVVSMNREISVFDVEKRCLSDWSLQNPKLTKLTMMVGEVRGAQFRPEHDDSALVWSDRSICHVNFSMPIPTFVPRKAKHHKSDQPGVNMRIVTLQAPDSILSVGFTGMNSAVLLRAHWSKIEMMLPPPVYRVRFGLS